MGKMNDFKVIYELIRYQYKQYILSSKWIMPMIALLAVVSVMYSITPVKVVNSFSIMSLFIFLLMVWIGVTNQNVEPEVSEQIIILRIKSERKYYISHILFMGMISVTMTVVSIGIPILNNILHSGGVFGRKIIWSDIIGGLILMSSCAFAGAMVGGLFHLRIINEKAIGIGATFFLSLLAIIRIGVIDKFPASKYILWIVPPVSDVVSWFSNKEYYDMGKIMVAFGIMMIYGVALAIVKVELMRIRKF